MTQSAGMSRAEMVEAAIEASWQLARGRGNPELLELDLTMAQFKTLTVLGREGPVPIGEVAEWLNIGQATASHLVDKLVHAGLAEREEDAADRRRTLARLSPRGQMLFDTVVQGGMNRYRDLLFQLDDDDLAALLRGLQALARLSTAHSGNEAIVHSAK